MAKETKTNAKTGKENKGLLDEVERVVASGAVDPTPAPCADGRAGSADRFADAMNPPEKPFDGSADPADSAVDTTADAVGDGESDKDKPVRRKGIQGKINEYCATLSREEVVEKCRLGGIRSGESRRIKRDGGKTAREAILMILANEVPEKTVDKLMGEYKAMLKDPEARKNLDGMSVLMARMYLEATENGNVKAAEFVRDTAGYKPVEQVQLDASVMTDQDRALMDKVAKRVGIKPEE